MWFTAHLLEGVVCVCWNVPPSRPDVPELPVEPALPVDPVLPVLPALPVDPVLPADPVDPVEPVLPADPAEPDEDWPKVTDTKPCLGSGNVTFIIPVDTNCSVSGYINL